MICHWCLTRVTRQSPLLELELSTFHEHTSVFCGVGVAQCLLFCIVCCGSLFVFLSFFFWSLPYQTFLWQTLSSNGQEYNQPQQQKPPPSVKPQTVDVDS